MEAGRCLMVRDVPCMPLIKAVAIQADCMTLSELQTLPRDKAAGLALALKRVRATSAPLREWNDALVCLTGAPPELTRKAAKERLIALLSNKKGDRKI